MRHHRLTITRREPITLAPRTTRHRQLTIHRRIATDTPPATMAPTVRILVMACRPGWPPTTAAHLMSQSPALVERQLTPPPVHRPSARPAPDRRSPANPQPDGDFRGPDAACLQSAYLSSLPPRGRHTALIAALTLGLGNALPLALQHGLAFGLTHGADDASINLPVLVAVSSGWLPEIDRTLRETFLASSRATIASRSPTDLARRSSLTNGEAVTFSDEIEGRLKLLALGDRGHLLAGKSSRIRLPEGRAPALPGRLPEPGRTCVHSLRSSENLSHIVSIT